MNIKSTLDITKEHCPMTFVKTRLALDKLDQGEVLEVILNKGEPLTNVPKSAKELGFEVLDIMAQNENIYKVFIQK